MYNRDKDREDYERWQRYGHERGWFEKSKDELSSWFGDEDAERRRRLDRAESDRHDRYSGRRQDTPNYTDWLADRDLEGPRTYPNYNYYGKRNGELRRATPYTYQSGYSSSTRYDESQDYPGNWGQSDWGATTGRESEFVNTQGSPLSPWTNEPLRDLRGRRGPRNYKRSDERISDDIHEKFDRHPRLDSRDVTIEVKDGEVTLKGQVHTRLEKRMIEEMSEDVFGVRNVQNLVRVQETAEPHLGSGTSALNSSPTVAPRLQGPRL